MSKTQNNPTEKKARKLGTVYPFFTLSELKKLLGYKSATGAKSFLTKFNVPIHLIGNKYIVFLTDLSTNAPELFSSILEANSLNCHLDPAQEMDFYTKLK